MSSDIKYTLNTPVYVSIHDRGVWFPEFEGYGPYQGYLCIEDVISIINRNVDVDFPKQSAEKEISNAIEEILLEYENKKLKLKEKRGIEVGTNIDTAMNYIQNYNDSIVHKTEEEKRDEDSLFDYSKTTKRIVENLSDTELMSKLYNDDNVASMNAEDRLKQADIRRKSEESVKKMRKQALDDLSSQTEVLNNLFAETGCKPEDFSFDELLEFDIPHERKQEKLNSKPKFTKNKPRI